MSIALDRFCFIVSLAKPAAVELSVCLGVGGCGCSSSMSVVQMGTMSWALTNSAPTSDSAAEAMMFLRMGQTVWMGPLSGGWLVGNCGMLSECLLRKRWPPTQLRALGSDR